MAGGLTLITRKPNTIVSHRRWECDCVRDNFFKIWKFFSGRRLRRGIRLMRRKRPCPCRGRQKNLQVGMVWKSEKGERQRPLPREKENRGHGKDADKRKPQTRRNGIARESKSGKTCGTRCSLLIIIAPGSWSVERRLPPPASGCSRGIRYGCCSWALTVRAGKLCRIDAREHSYKGRKPLSIRRCLCTGKGKDKEKLVRMPRIRQGKEGKGIPSGQNRSQTKRTPCQDLSPFREVRVGRSP